MPLFSGVGLAPNATVQIRLEARGPQGEGVASPNAFAVLLNEEQLEDILPWLGNAGAQQPQSLYFPSAWRASLATPFNGSHQVVAEEAARYWLGVLQVTPKSAQGLVGEVSYSNPGGDQLPVQQRGVPSVLLFWACAFFCSAFALSLMVVLRRRGRSRLHLVVLFALLSKSCVLLLIRSDVVALSITGRTSIGRQVVWQLLKQVQLVAEVMMFYLIGLGYKVVRSQLRPSEQAFGATVVCVSLCLGGFEVACSTIMTCHVQSYLLAQYTLHSMCFLVVIVAVNFNIFTLQRQISEALAAPETGALYAKHRAYCWFRGFFLYKVIIPSVTNFMTLHVISWSSLWVVVFVREGSLWVIYTALLWLFRPGQKSLKVFDLAIVDSSESEVDEDPA